MTTTIPTPTSTNSSSVPGAAAAESTARLSLTATPEHRHGLVDGAWWPRSRDATAELPALIAAVDRRLGRRTFRVNLGRPAWDNVPRQLPVPGRTVKVAWYRTIDPLIVSLTVAGAEDLVLVVVPPETPPATAHNALALSIGTGDPSPAEVLGTASAMTLAEPASTANRTPADHATIGDHDASASSPNR